jgi:hypothetical protein
MERTMNDCECQTWATDAILPGGHHYGCDKFDAKPTVALLRRLVEGINSWASMEDGVYSEVWDAYCEASDIVGSPVDIHEPT